MNVSEASELLVYLLQYCAPAAFIWALVERGFLAIVRAASGRWKEGL